MTTPLPSRLARLAAIRVAILLAILMFGAVAWTQRRAPDWVPPQDVQLRPLRYAGMAAWTIALAGIIGLRLKYAREADGASNPRIAIMAWALGELPALYGVVFFYITGDLSLYAAGVAALIVSFLLFPAAKRVHERP